MLIFVPVGFILEMRVIRIAAPITNDLGVHVLL